MHRIATKEGKKKPRAEFLSLESFLESPRHLKRDHDDLKEMHTPNLEDQTDGALDLELPRNINCV